MSISPLSMPLDLPHSDRPDRDLWKTFRPWSKRYSHSMQRSWRWGITRDLGRWMEVEELSLWINGSWRLTNKNIENNNQTNKQSMNKTNHQPNKQANQQSSNQTIDQSMNQLINQSISQSVNQSINQSINQCLSISTSRLDAVALYWRLFDPQRSWKLP